MRLMTKNDLYGLYQLCLANDGRFLTGYLGNAARQWFGGWDIHRLFLRRGYVYSDRSGFFYKY